MKSCITRLFSIAALVLAFCLPAFAAEQKPEQKSMSPAPTQFAKVVFPEKSFLLDGAEINIVGFSKDLSQEQALRLVNTQAPTAWTYIRLDETKPADMKLMEQMKTGKNADRVTEGIAELKRVSGRDDINTFYVMSRAKQQQAGTTAKTDTPAPSGGTL
ncbi:hypothetical protein KW799_02165 [Candidatus Parcubacteria bacterium]|nr:hypothetical protein [Candidatus Parcubacteria bacterium]